MANALHLSHASDCIISAMAGSENMQKLQTRMHTSTEQITMRNQLTSDARISARQNMYRLTALVTRPKTTSGDMRPTRMKLCMDE